VSSSAPGAVFLLDDDPDLLASLAEMIQTLFDRPCVVADSFASMVAQEATVLGCAVAILDINLGANRPSGVDAYRWLKQAGFAGRVAFLTGHVHQQPPVDSAVEVIHKPASLSTLRALVDG
jgi:FixJ family two-component response regulator